MRSTLKFMVLLCITTSTCTLSTVAIAKPISRPIAKPIVKPSPNQPPDAVMNKFYNYLNGNYGLYLGDDRGACSYNADPAAIRVDGTDRFFLAKISRGKVGTACRGILAFQIMQADCKANKLYGFRREEADGKDVRLLGWERFEMSLSDPNRADQEDKEPQSQKVLTTLCRSSGI